MMPMYWGGGWIAWVVMSAFMLVFWGALIWAIVYAMRSWGVRHAPGRREGSGALDILEERFARGEVDEMEFRKRRETLLRH